MGQPVHLLDLKHLVLDLVSTVSLIEVSNILKELHPVFVTNCA
jgi:hypothetical protein